MRPPKLWHIAANFVGLFDVPLAFKHMAIHASGRLTPEEATFVPDAERRKKLAEELYRHRLRRVDKVVAAARDTAG